MKKIFYTTIIILFSFSTFAQTLAEPPIQSTSTDGDIGYRLFATKNMYTFIKLNTSNGQMDLLQWNTESKYRTVFALSDVSLVSKDQEKNGRFFLYPTPNMYNFILLDQLDGRTWQVQWGKQNERLIIEIK